MMDRLTFSDNTETSRFFRQICSEGECLHLNPQQRLPIPPADKVIVLREGMLAVDVMPTKGKLQVLDFLGAGDVVSVSTLLPTPRVSLRAITSASLTVLDTPEPSGTELVQDYWAFLMARCTNQLTRTYVHQLMIGRLETEPRVASFILALALRSPQRAMRSVTVALPMSRDDIANYLVINCDTLSRTMMKFCDSGLIERESRHAIRVLDLESLKKKSPLATLLSAVSLNDDVQPSIVDVAPKSTEHFTSSYDSPFVHLPPGAVSSLARARVQTPSVSRHGL